MASDPRGQKDFEDKYMNIRGIIFDVYGTLIDIQTDEGYEEIYRSISHFLTYRGIYMRRGEVKASYYGIMENQRKASHEEYFEFDVIGLWQEFLKENAGPSNFPTYRLKGLPLCLAEMYRGISRQRMQLYPEVKALLDELLPRFKLASVSDAQRFWVVPEMKALGIESYFKTFIISSDLGFRKPDKRIFKAALAGLALEPEEVIFVGNDMYRDIFGAGQLGIRTVFFSSNQGRKEMEGVDPDYIIYNFAELRQAIKYFESE
jgi:putative hydrolase of the HAD superfamily